MTNPNCDKGRCTAPSGEVRLLPIGGGGNMILCKHCFELELRWRRSSSCHNRNFEYPKWQELKPYNAE